MALTGNIEVFPLPEVLRLLARSGRNGCLRVDAGTVDGRIYLREGTLTLATVSTDAEFLDQLAASGMIDDQRISEGVVLTEALAPGSTPEELADFVREHVIEALYRIRRPGSGSFEFLVDADPRVRTGQAFDTERVVSDADRRAADWAEIEQTIDDMHRPVRMAPSLRENEVTINAPTWRVLASLEGGSSISQIARHLGTTEFRAAREIAGLMRASLIEPLHTAVRAEPPAAPAPVFRPAPAPAPAPETETPQTDWFATAPEPEAPQTDWFATPAPERPHDPPAHEQPADQVQSPWATSPAPESTVHDWDAQPWSEPAPAPATPADEPEEDAAQQTTEPQSEPSRGGWWAEAMGAADEVDTDEFLESVFSQAESPAETDEEETGFSMGLLRRRRMGPAARDISDAN